MTEHSHEHHEKGETHEKVETPEKTQRQSSLEERNGIRRPAGGATGRVWDTADNLSKKHGRPVTRGELFEALSDMSQGTVATQYGRWRTFYGIKAMSAEERIARMQEARAAKEAERQAAKAEKEAKKKAEKEAKVAAKAAAKKAGTAPDTSVE